MKITKKLLTRLIRQAIKESRYAVSPSGVARKFDVSDPSFRPENPVYHLIKNPGGPGIPTVYYTPEEALQKYFGVTNVSDLKTEQERIEAQAVVDAAKKKVAATQSASRTAEIGTPIEDVSARATLAASPADKIKMAVDRRIKRLLQTTSDEDLKKIKVLFDSTDTESQKQAYEILYGLEKIKPDEMRAISIAIKQFEKTGYIPFLQSQTKDYSDLTHASKNLEFPDAFQVDKNGKVIPIMPGTPTYKRPFPEEGAHGFARTQTGDFGRDTAIRSFNPGYVGPSYEIDPSPFSMRSIDKRTKEREARGDISRRPFFRHLDGSQASYNEKSIFDMSLNASEEEIYNKVLDYDLYEYIKENILEKIEDADDDAGLFIDNFVNDEYLRGELLYYYDEANTDDTLLYDPEGEVTGFATTLFDKFPKVVKFLVMHALDELLEENKIMFFNGSLDDGDTYFDHAAGFHSGDWSPY